MSNLAEKLRVRQRAAASISRRVPFAACAIAALTISACAAEVKRVPPALDPASAEAPEGWQETPRSLAGPLSREAMPLTEQAPKATDAPDHAHTGPTREQPADGPSEHEKSAGHGAPGRAPGHSNGHSEHGEARQPTVYACPMHPEVRQDRPGSCPKCGMKLVPEKGAVGKVETTEPKGSSGSTSEKTPAAKDHKRASYTCPMHPEVRQDAPGKCPKCGMKLVPEEEGPPSGKRDGHP